MSETHTAPSHINDRVVFPIDSIESFNVQSTDRLNRQKFESMTSTHRSSIPQTSSNIKQRTQQYVLSMDTDLNRISQPIYQSTPKLSKRHNVDDVDHETEDELREPKQNYDVRRRITKGYLRDFSQSTSQPIDRNLTVQQTTTNFNEKNMENILSHVPISKGTFHFSYLCLSIFDFENI